MSAAPRCPEIVFSWVGYCWGNDEGPLGRGPSDERTTRLELATFCLEGRDSSQLSYVRSAAGAAKP